MGWRRGLSAVWQQGLLRAHLDALSALCQPGSGNCRWKSGINMHNSWLNPGIRSIETVLSLLCILTSLWLYLTYTQRIISEYCVLLSWFICLFLYQYLEKAVATHSSTLAWKIPWTEEPGWLQSMGSRRVGHNWATSLSLFTLMHWRRKWQPTPVFLPGDSQEQRNLVSSRLWDRTKSDTSDVT